MVDGVLKKVKPVTLKYPKSPLRYPGGKTRASKYIVSYFPKGITRLCSPFFGGGSIEFLCSYSGIKVYGYDIFAPLVNFWNELLNNPKELSRRVKKYYPLTKKKFYNLQKTYINFDDIKEKAAVFFVLNRSSFSGTTLSGGMSPGHQRFTPFAIDRIKNFRTPNVQVKQMDFQESIKKHEKDFLYLDPPYANGQALYGDRGNTHKEFNHEKLAKILNKRGNWILSYNDCDKVRDLYKKHLFLYPKWSYGMNNSKKSNEVLIISQDLA